METAARPSRERGDSSPGLLARTRPPARLSLLLPSSRVKPYLTSPPSSPVGGARLFASRSESWRGGLTRTRVEDSLYYCLNSHNGCVFHLASALVTVTLWPVRLVACRGPTFAARVGGDLHDVAGSSQLRLGARHPDRRVRRARRDVPARQRVTGPPRRLICSIRRDFLAIRSSAGMITTLVISGWISASAVPCLSSARLVPRRHFRRSP